MESLVSVIMPVYNAEKFLAEAITSVYSQTHQNWELLIINDGSTDDSIEIIRTFSDPRVRYFEQPNKGVSAARNNGLLHMRGDFFCFLDADDVMPPDSLTYRLEVFQHDRDAQFVDGAVEVYDEILNNLMRTWTPVFEGYPLTNLIRLDNRCFFGPTWMVRVNRTMIYQMDETMTHGEDLFFYITIAHQGKYNFTPHSILRYRKNSKSAMSNLDGLAHGYTKLRRNVFSALGSKTTALDKLILQWKTRKIMFLSFLNKVQWRKAFQYLLTGSI